MMKATDVSIEHIIDSALARHRGKIGPLLPVLHDIQQAVGYVPDEVVPKLGQVLNLSRAEIHGVISFYHDFRTAPAGKHRIQLCRAEACQAVGARELESHVRERLGIDMGQTTADGSFSLEAVYCLGNCACGPSIRIGDDFHARVSGDTFDTLINALEADD